MSDFYSLTPELGGMTEVAMYEARHLFQQGAAYYEFGLFQGYNFWRAWRTGISPMMEYHGFDSFEGMPDNDTGYEAWHKGAYAVSMSEVRDNLNRHGMIDDPKIKLHKGWFSDEWFASLRERYHFPPAGVVVVDCDLYESTVPVLEFIRPYLVPGTIILLDDWTDQPGDGERRAWNEFVARHPIEYDGYDYGRFSHHVTIRRSK